MVDIDPNPCIHGYLKTITFIIDSFTLISKQTYVKRQEKQKKRRELQNNTRFKSKQNARRKTSNFLEGMIPPTLQYQTKDETQSICYRTLRKSSTQITSPLLALIAWSFINPF